jgi:hypothetical protein
MFGILMGVRISNGLKVIFRKDLRGIRGREDKK